VERIKKFVTCFDSDIFIATFWPQLLDGEKTKIKNRYNVSIFTLKRLLEVLGNKTVIGKRTINHWSFLAPQGIIIKDCCGFILKDGELSGVEQVKGKAIVIIMDENGDYFEVLHFTKQYLDDFIPKCTYLKEVNLIVRATRIWVAKSDVDMASPFKMSIGKDSTKLKVNFKFFAFNSLGNIDCMVYDHTGTAPSREKTEC